MNVHPVAAAGCLSCILVAFTHAPTQIASSTFAPDSVQPNDNRTPGGSIVNGTTELQLVARIAAWRPDLDVDSTLTIQAFGETGGAPRIPGPLLRAEQGRDVRVTITNDIPDSTLVVHGMRAGTVADDTIVVRPGTRREVTFRESPCTSLP